jgi:hypothetical protein
MTDPQTAATELLTFEEIAKFKPDAGRTSGFGLDYRRASAFIGGQS